MPFLVLTRSGWDDLLKASAGHIASPIWMSEGVLTEEEIKTHRLAGLDITNFTRRITHDDPLSIRSAIDTVQQHHPKQPVWVEDSA